MIEKCPIAFERLAQIFSVDVFAPVPLLFQLLALRGKLLGDALDDVGTRQSGKTKLVLMRQGCDERLRNALYHWARTSVVWDAASKKIYAQLRVCGHSHGKALRSMADRWLKVLASMLSTRTLFDPQRMAAGR
jgi:hypothetical protein